MGHLGLFLAYIHSIGGPVSLIRHCTPGMVHTCSILCYCSPVLLTLNLLKQSVAWLEITKRSRDIAHQCQSISQDLGLLAKLVHWPYDAVIDPTGGFTQPCW